MQYLTGQCLDLPPLIAASRGAPARVSVWTSPMRLGNTLLDLHDWNADFAVWCSYKYLNAGPGAVGGCFIQRAPCIEYDLAALCRLVGTTQVDAFHDGTRVHSHRESAEGWQISNPPILSAAPLLASLEMFERADIRRLRAKSIALTRFLTQLIEGLLPGRSTSSRRVAAEERGCQLSLRIARPAHEARRCHTTV